MTTDKGIEEELTGLNITLIAIAVIIIIATLTSIYITSMFYSHNKQGIIYCKDVDKNQTHTFKDWTDVMAYNSFVGGYETGKLRCWEWSN